MSETLKIEAGRYYKCRDGRKAFVATIAHPNPFGETAPSPVAGYVERVKYPVQWSDKGVRASGDRNLDLLEPWREPRVIERQVTVNDCDDSLCMSMGRVHPKPRDKPPLASCVLRYTEGKGFEIVTEGDGLPKEQP